MAMMRSAHFTGLQQIRVDSVAVPTIQAQTDAVVKITTAAICGTDLHTYNGYLGVAYPPWAIGHEALGYIDSIGSGVSQFKRGGYVVIPDVVGQDPNNKALYGLGMGAPGGLQAEYARVPYADTNLISVPLTKETTNETAEEDYMVLGDILPTAWEGLNFAGFQPGDTVAVFGAGPVGLMACASALVRGASKVYAIDHETDRLELARSIGAIPLNFMTSDIVQQLQQREPNGVDVSVDCVGEEAVDANNEMDEGVVTRNMMSVTKTNGGIGQPGVYLSMPLGVGAPRGNLIPNLVPISLTDMWSKSLAYRGGMVDLDWVWRDIIGYINNGSLRPSFITSARIGIEQVPEYYRRFANHQEIKVFIHFPRTD